MLTREEYFNEYRELGKKMFSTCIIPNVYTFVDAYVNKNQEAIDEIETITSFTGNTSDITNSVNRRNNNYTEEESKKFMKSVIAANVTDITASGFFYKKLISSCDDMTIEIDDCGSEGEEIKLPVDEDIFNYKIKNRWVVELNKYIESYDELPKRGKIHIRTFLSCKHGERHFCKKCAGLFRRSYDTEFTPKNIGVYSTLMITEHATQASLDSMNNGTSEKINVILERPIEDPIKNIDEAKDKIREIIDIIGNVGVESRFYEIALLSRWRNNKFSPLITSFLKQEDLFGAFIYRPSISSLVKLIMADEFNAESMKTKIAFDMYDD